MRYSFFSLLSVSFLVIFMFLFGMLGAQGVKLGVQGILKTNDGTAAPDGTYSITFKLYDVAESGSALWSETQSNVVVTSGLYSAVLGSVTALSLPFNTDYFLGVSVGSTPEMTPRLQLTTAPYALSLKGSTNTFPNTGPVGIGTLNPASGYQLHMNKVTGAGSQFLEGSTGANLEFVKGSNITTAGLTSADNIFRVNSATNALSFQYNGSNKLEVNSSGLSVTGSGTFSNGLTLSSGTALFGNISMAGNSIDCPANTDIKLNGSTKLTINQEGVAMPGHLVINGSKSIYNGGRHARYANDCGGGPNCPETCCDSDYNSNYSMECDNRVRATEFNAYSDRRIKKDIMLSDRKRDMEIMRGLQVANYRHTDVIGQGADFKKGFIAQEVEQVFSEAVALTTNFIPDVYQLAAAVAPQGNNLVVTLSQPHQLKAGDRIRVTHPGEQEEYFVGAVEDDYHFTISGWGTEKPDWLFVYGKQVADFRQVDYDRIHTLNVSVTQELIRSMEALESEIGELKNENNKLKERRDRLDTQLRKLEVAVSN
jgi:hypothetical protein